ncbi:MAG: response regulator transcription factor [Flavobacteriales bacterium]|jgi:DNA-binding NarL/FixJ family response regulator|nr:response regulator transcription factor [Flavobacteriales bacterium]MBK9514039.1 response regulator transcription factor [Flavobacteriales bacterium]MBP7448415.1 response regulator transcription factor [Flavobacteriales bacterium]HOZ41673.1 response regulator transcription factor [Flavobacteriales bacterium]
MGVRIVIADHSELAIIGLQAIFSGVPNVEVLGIARDPIELQALLVRYHPQVVLIDHTAEGFHARDIKEGLKRSKRTRFVSITPDPSSMALMSAIRSGVTSYIKKDCDVQEIIDSVLRTAEGAKFFCGKILESLKRSSFDVERFLNEPLSCAAVTLSDRECEVVQLIAEGLSYTRIAEQLHLSAHTVNTHRRNVMQKLGVNNTAAVVMYAVKNGLVSPNRYLFERSA